MSKYDELKARSLASGVTLEQWIEALSLASGLAGSNAFPISAEKLIELDNQNPLAFEIFEASMLDNMPNMPNMPKGGAR